MGRAAVKQAALGGAPGVGGLPALALSGRRGPCKTCPETRNSPFSHKTRSHRLGGVPCRTIPGIRRPRVEGCERPGPDGLKDPEMRKQLMKSERPLPNRPIYTAFDASGTQKASANWCLPRRGC